MTPVTVVLEHFRQQSKCDSGDHLKNWLRHLGEAPWRRRKVLAERQAKLTSATQLWFPAGACLVSTVSCLFRLQTIVGVGASHPESMQSRKVCDDEIMTSDDAFKGNPNVCCCSWGLGAHFNKKILFPCGAEGELRWLEEGREDGEDQCRGSFSHGQTPMPPSIQEWLSGWGCTRLTVVAGPRVVHYFIILTSLQLRHVRLVSLSSFAAPPESVLLLLCI